jgi:hypothetical protein
MACMLCMASHLALADPSKADELPDSKVLRQKIKDDGADAVYKSELDGQNWLSFLRKVETGKKPWLEVATAIYPATDAGPAEDLTMAVGEAILRSPRDVLLLAAPVLGIESVCDYSEMTMDYRNIHTPQQASKDIDVRIHVLRALTSTDVAARRDQCVDLLEKAKTELLSPTWK